MSWVAVAMAGAGLLKSELSDKPKAEQQRKLRAAEIRYSPWTKMGPTTQVQEADPLGSVMQGATSGMMMGQAMKDPMPQTNYNMGAAPGSGNYSGWESVNPMENYFNKPNPYGR